jgi:hypothetical protein
LWRHFAASATSGTHAAAVHVGFSRRAPAAGFIDLVKSFTIRLLLLMLLRSA